MATLDLMSEKKNRHADVFQHVLSLCQIGIKSVFTCLRYGCGHIDMDARTDMKIKTKSISPHFGLTSTGANNAYLWIY